MKKLALTLLAVCVTGGLTLTTANTANAGGFGRFKVRRPTIHFRKPKVRIRTPRFRVHNPKVRIPFSRYRVRRLRVRRPTARRSVTGVKRFGGKLSFSSRRLGRFTRRTLNHRPFANNKGIAGKYLGKFSNQDFGVDYLAGKAGSAIVGAPNPTLAQRAQGYVIGKTLYRGYQLGKPKVKILRRNFRRFRTPPRPKFRKPW